jgi:hypothetical protein
MKTAAVNPFIPDFSLDSVGSDTFSEAIRRRPPGLLSWFLRTWLGTGVGGGIFGALLVAAGGPLLMMFGSMFGLWIAICGGLVSTFVGLLLLLVVRIWSNGRVARVMIAALCGGTCGAISTGMFSGGNVGELSISAVAGVIGAVSAGFPVYLEGRRASSVREPGDTRVLES